jgi:very-short-patch-repair endonuclease
MSIKRDEKWLNPNTGMYICPICKKEFSGMGICSHIWRSHTEEGDSFKPCLGKEGWSRGLTKETDERLNNLSKSLKNVVWGKREKLSEEHKKKISEGMKRAHKEGRAWNIGKSRWNNKPSYPEIFFAKVIENEFFDKEYQKEYPISIWSFDFAWPHKKRAIEIDGDQYIRFKEYKERDKRKDDYAMREGWSILRIKWKDFCKDTKSIIKISKKFIDS